MNRGQALAAVYGNPGKRYRDKNWNEGSYIYVSPETGNLCDESGVLVGDTFHISLYESGLNSGDWEEWKKPKVVANGIAELFAKDDGNGVTWIGEDGFRYFVGSLGDLLKYDPPSPIRINPSLLRQKFTLFEKEDKS